MSAVDHTISEFIQGQNSLSHIFKIPCRSDYYHGVGLSCNNFGDESNFPSHGSLTDTSKLVTLFSSVRTPWPNWFIALLV